MMLAGFLFLLLLRDGQSSNRSCSHRDVLNHLNLTKMNNLNSMTRPGNADSPIVVALDVLLYAILDVNELDQKFISYLWIDATWQDDDIYWNSSDFCSINKIYLPTKLVWRPDLTIEEMTEIKNSHPISYVTVSSNGNVLIRYDMVVGSTCRMHIHKFPFDVQSCTLSFKTIIHFVEDVRLTQMVNSVWNTEWSRKKMQTQSEWLFINMTTVSKNVDNFGFNQSMLVYTINMKRRSALYIANFLLPILFFLFLDLASFLISDSSGEKLSFKVTVLLAVTVMQLILNEILPSASDKIPLIAVYCIGIFGLMMLSLLETIFVMYLMEKDSAPEDNKAAKEQSLSEERGAKLGNKVSFQNCFREVKKLTRFACICDVSPGETSSELLSVAKEGSESQMTAETYTSEKLSNELSEAMTTLTLLLSSKKEGEKPCYWTRVAKIINKVFFVFYVIAVSVFLLCMFFIWNYDDQF